MRKSKGCFKMGPPMLTKMLKNGAPQATHTMPDGTVMPGAKHGAPFKGANSKNSSCWDGYKKCGTKKSPSGAGNGPVNNCVPEGQKCK